MESQSIQGNAGRRAPASGPVRISGLSGAALAYAVSKIARNEPLAPYVKGPLARTQLEPRAGRKLLIVTSDNAALEKLSLDLNFFLPERSSCEVVEFPAWDVLPFDGLSPSTSVTSARLQAMQTLLSDSGGVIVTTADALLQRVPEPSLLRKAEIRLAVGEEIDRERLMLALVNSGYVRSSVVEDVGQFAVRGSILDVYPPGSVHPLRLELFADRLESVRSFDEGTQRSLAGEVYPDRMITLPAASEFLGPWVDSQADLSGSIGRADARAESLEEASRALRERASALDLPARTIDPLLDALQSGATWPGMEHLLPLFGSKCVSIFELLSVDTDIVVCDPTSVSRAAEQFSDLVREREFVAKKEGILFAPRSELYSSAGEVLTLLDAKASFVFEELHFISISEGDVEHEPEVELDGRALQLAFSRQHGLDAALKRSRHEELPLKPLADEIRKNWLAGTDVAVVVSHLPKAKRLKDLLRSYDLEVEEWTGSFNSWQQGAEERRKVKHDSVWILHGASSSGLRSPVERFSLISDLELFPEVSHRKPVRASQSIRKVLGAAAQLKENDFVVHMDHGVAIYRGLRTMSVEGRSSDFLQLEYAEGAKLFVPVENIGKVQRYIGSEGVTPSLTKLGGKSWNNAKEKVRKEVVEIAGQLLNLYAQRELVEGQAFPPEDEDDARFAETFPFQETPDQEKAINDVLSDMSQTKPMDRLVCGDVGFGKTEVALRAAFKAVNTGRQVAFLVPTTILADQHFVTFKNRFADFPFKVGCVSRFYTADENRKTLEKVASGEIDVIIGTHRILQKDVYFKNLGLVIIDEEHRFGVADKEKLKKMRREVHVLTMTATPIPRTLYMSLFDIRDLSVIETPPTDRQIIRTYLAPYQEGIVKEAIQRELGRGGQVFFIHNRVASIAHVAKEVQELLPEARVDFAHGQMKDHELEKVMHKFISHEADVLVSTTIVESGLDIPNANTIVIKDADRLGLAELYQLRGRVGRSSRRAYAYLLVSDTKHLGADAKKRLQVLQSLDDLGMGFRLALQDMEIRGAGNLLGKDQTGKIELVGFELYSRILREAVRELRARRSGGPQQSISLDQLIDPEVKSPFPSHIPQFYVPDVEERLLLYQRLSELRSEEEGIEIAEEISDRFGHMPQEVSSLVELMVFRAALRRYGITAASFRGKTLSVTFHRDSGLDVEAVSRAVFISRGRIRLSPQTMTVSIAVDENSIESPASLTAILRSTMKLIGGS